jgi:hypothetical protein
LFYTLNRRSSKDGGKRELSHQKFLVLDFSKAEQPLFEKSVLSVAQDPIASESQEYKGQGLDFAMSNLANLLILRPAI